MTAHKSGSPTAMAAQLHPTSQNASANKSPVKQAVAPLHNPVTTRGTFRRLRPFILLAAPAKNASGTRRAHAHRLAVADSE